jgi:hypothetical protein
MEQKKAVPPAVDAHPHPAAHAAEIYWLSEDPVLWAGLELEGCAFYLVKEIRSTKSKIQNVFIRMLRQYV